MYVLLKNKFSALKLESYLLNKQRPINRYSINTCAVDYVLDQVKGRRGFKTYTYDKVKEEIYGFVAEGDTKISAEELINWPRNAIVMFLFVPLIVGTGNS